MNKPKTEASKRDDNRRPGYIIPEFKGDSLTPEQRLAEHLESKRHIGPDPRTVRLTIRAAEGGEKGAEGPLVRMLYDIANAKPKRRRRRRKREQPS